MGNFGAGNITRRFCESPNREPDSLLEDPENDAVHLSFL